MATYKELYDSYFTELNNIADLLTKFVGTYKTLVDSANTLNSIALTKKSEIKKALKRAVAMGDIIDELIDAIDEADFCYLDYLSTKSQYISKNIKKESVLGELGAGLVIGSLLNNVPAQTQNVFIDGIKDMFKNKKSTPAAGGGNQENSNNGNNSGPKNSEKDFYDNDKYNQGENSQSQNNEGSFDNEDNCENSQYSDDKSYYNTSKDDGFEE